MFIDIEKNRQQPMMNLNNMNDCLQVAKNLLERLQPLSGLEQKWFSKRVCSLLKSALQSAEHLNPMERGNLQNELREIIDGFIKYGYKSVKDRTLSLAYCNLDLYFFLLRKFYRIKGFR